MDMTAEEFRALLPEQPEVYMEGAIPGEREGCYFVALTWNYRPSYMGYRVGCIVAVTPGQDGPAWERVFEFDDAVCCIVRLSANCILIGTGKGNLIKLTGSDANMLSFQHPGGILTAWRVSETEFWLGGEGGLIHLKDGALMQYLTGESGLCGVHGLDADFMVAVGDDGLILVRDNDRWQRHVSVLGDYNLLGVLCVARDKILVCSWRCVLYWWDGADQWQEIEVSGNFVLDELAFSSPFLFQGEVYVCSGEHGIFRVTGNQAEQVWQCSASSAMVIDGKLALTGGSSFTEINQGKINVTHFDLSQRSDLFSPYMRQARPDMAN